MNNDFNDYFKTNPNTPRGRRSSVHKSKNYSEIRFKEAEEQAKHSKIDKKKIIDYTNECLKNIIGIKVDNLPIEKNLNNINYSEIKDAYNLADRRDIIWMKFTEDGYLGVVATSNDINFNIPKSKEDYDNKYKSKWEYNTSGILVHHLGKSWDETFVLIFPLKAIPNGYSRGDIERVVGNYLIDKNVPIIDFYSHNY